MNIVASSSDVKLVDELITMDDITAVSGTGFTTAPYQ
jgi:hypothetical protein